MEKTNLGRDIPEMTQKTLAVVPDPLPAPVVTFTKKLCAISLPPVQSMVTIRLYNTHTKKKRNIEILNNSEKSSF